MSDRIKITQIFAFDAAHRVLHHESKCKTLHGHRYTVHVTVSAPKLDSLGRVIDFSVLKATYGQWIDMNWDHKTILNPDDPLVGVLLAGGFQDHIFKMPISDHGFKSFSDGMNPTAENLAQFLLHKLGTCRLPKGYENVRVEKIVLWETPNCCSEVSA